MKNIIYYLFGLILIAQFNCARAQVFSGSNDGNKAASKSYEDKNAVKAPVTQSDNVINSETRVDEFGEVKKNFSGQRKSENKRDASERSVYNFKVVNGNIIFNDPSSRNVLIYYDNYELHQGMDQITRCSFRLYVLNDLTEKITSIAFRLIWPDISTTVQMSQLKPGVRTYSDMMLMGDGCLHLNKTPTIEINRCRVKGMTEDKCADAVHWYPINSSK